VVPLEGVGLGGMKVPLFVPTNGVTLWENQNSERFRGVVGEVFFTKPDLG
jgi:hypothetical protein